MFESIKRYRRYGKYNKRGGRLDADIMSMSADVGTIRRAARMLGIGGGQGAAGGVSEQDARVMTDFVVCDVRGAGGKTPAQAHMDDPGPADDIERILLEARISSRTSLFRVEAKDPGLWTTDLSDLLRRGEAATIIDRGLSKAASVGQVVFARLYRMPELSTTSGIAFPFMEDKVPTLIRRYRRMRMRPGKRGPASRYALFFKMHRMYGLPFEGAG